LKGQLKHIVLWVILVGTVAVLAGFARADRSEQRCWRLDIDVEHLSGLYFIDDASVREHILNLGDPIVGSRLDSLHTDEIRSALKRLPSVKEATVYTTVDGRLQVDVTQRSPLFRVWNNKNESYYVDCEGKRMPLSKQYTARVPVLTGNISTPFAPGAASEAEENKLNEAFALFSFIEADPFWAAQTEHIYINDEGDFVMIPRVGHCEIVLGDTTNLNAKFKRLKIFLHEISHSNNLNKYKRVNVKYRDQVVCERYF
jgi:cell division protein FtsQ